ncbi:hypothetical protein BgiMline_002094, partial [Biomphalaria glabrata]
MISSRPVDFLVFFNLSGAALYWLERYSITRSVQVGFWTEDLITVDDLDIMKKRGMIFLTRADCVGDSVCV